MYTRPFEDACLVVYTVHCMGCVRIIPTELRVVTNSLQPTCDSRTLHTFFSPNVNYFYVVFTLNKSHYKTELLILKKGPRGALLSLCNLQSILFMIDFLF